MPKEIKNRRIHTESLEQTKKRQAENRRKFLKSLKKKTTRDFAAKEFAKLGLFQ